MTNPNITTIDTVVDTDGVSKVAINGKVVSEAQMLELQSYLCDFFLSIMKKGVHYDPKLDKDVPLDAKMLSTISTFLAQNNIKGIPKAGTNVNDILNKFLRTNKALVDAAVADLPTYN